MTNTASNPEEIISNVLFYFIKNKLAMVHQ